MLWVLMSGCSSGDDSMGRALNLRSRLNAAQVCSFDAVIHADFGDKIYSFSMQCQVDSGGNLTFTVTEPATIAGITGRVSAQGGKLTFGDTALAFEMLAEGRLSPVSAPWVLVHTLKSGYITSCAQWEGGFVLSIDDRYEDDALNLTVYLGKDDLPVAAEIFWEGSRCLSLEIKNFVFE